MDAESGKLTVFFEGPFWVGIFERISGDKLAVCKVTFGAEPKDPEIWDFILKHYYELKFSPAIETKARRTAEHPKRRQRGVRKQLQVSGIGTKSQQALQMQREEMKTQKRKISKEQQEAEKQRQFDLKRQKRKAKHRGR